MPVNNGISTNLEMGFDLIMVPSGRPRSRAGQEFCDPSKINNPYDSMGGAQPRKCHFLEKQIVHKYCDTTEGSLVSPTI